MVKYRYKILPNGFGDKKWTKANLYFIKKTENQMLFG